MSRQLTRIRKLVSEIEEIQRHGQAKARVPLAAIPEHAPPGPVAEPAPQVEGRVAVTLSENVILEIKVDAESVEVKKGAEGVEISFEDGKAFHIPFRDVA